jgi:hypothetical protein
MLAFCSRMQAFLGLVLTAPMYLAYAAGYLSMRILAMKAMPLREVLRRVVRRGICPGCSGLVAGSSQAVCSIVAVVYVTGD